MARIRTVKPSFFKSLTVTELPKATRLTWIGLWTYCDDAGRGVDDARLIKAELWPLDDDYPAKKVEKDLQLLEANGSIRRYVVDGRRFLAVVEWHHQRIDKPTPSVLPAPPENEPVTLLPDSGNPPGILREEDGRVPYRNKEEELGSGREEDLRLTATPLSAEAEASPLSSEVVPITNGHQPWLDLLGPRLADLDTTGTWDLLTPYVESWDLIHDTVDPPHVMGNLIALTCDFVTRVTGEAPPDGDRSRIAMLVRSHGKAALLGYSKALGATQDETPEARFKYARGVISRFIRELEATG